MLEGKMYANLSYEKNSVAETIPVIHVMAAIQRKFQTNMEKQSSLFHIIIMAKLNRKQSQNIKAGFHRKTCYIHIC